MLKPPFSVALDAFAWSHTGGRSGDRWAFLVRLRLSLVLLVLVAQAGGEAPTLLVARAAGLGNAAAKLSPGAGAAECDAHGARWRPAVVTPSAGGCVLSLVPSDSAFLVPSDSDKRKRNPAWLEVDEQLHGNKQGQGQRVLSAPGQEAEGPTGNSPEVLPSRAAGRTSPAKPLSLALVFCPRPLTAFGPAPCQNSAAEVSPALHLCWLSWRN